MAKTTRRCKQRLRRPVSSLLEVVAVFGERIAHGLADGGGKKRLEQPLDALGGHLHRENDPRRRIAFRRERLHDDGACVRARNDIAVKAPVGTPLLHDLVGLPDPEQGHMLAEADRIALLRQDFESQLRMHPVRRVVANVAELAAHLGERPADHLLDGHFDHVHGISS